MTSKTTAHKSGLVLNIKMDDKDYIIINDELVITALQHGNQVRIRFIGPRDKYKLDRAYKSKLEPSGAV